MLKRALRSAASGLGYSVGRRLPDADAARLLAMLRPVATPLPLIRLGGDRDGGYLVPDDLDGIAACFSPGVDVTASFEADLVARGIRCHLADASVDGPPIASPLVDFEQAFLGVDDDDRLITLDGWVARKAPGDGDLLLQMDIEGDEWAVLLNAAEATLRRFRIVVLELHGLEHCAEPLANRLFAACLGRLTRLFHVVHLHPNNAAPPVRVGSLTAPPFLEVTLLRKDRAEPTGWATRFPHPLDRPNLPERPDVALPAALICGMRG